MEGQSSLIETIKSIQGIVRISRAKYVWGEIVSFKKLPEKPIEPHQENEGPDYFIEVRYEYDGKTHTRDSIIKKEIHYEKGGKIKIFLPDGNAESAIVDYNVVVGYYVALITSLFIGIFILYISFFRGALVDMSIRFPPAAPDL